MWLSYVLGVCSLAVTVLNLVYRYKIRRVRAMSKVDANTTLRFDLTRYGLDLAGPVYILLTGGPIWIISAVLNSLLVGLLWTWLNHTELRDVRACAAATDSSLSMKDKVDGDGDDDASDAMVPKNALDHRKLSWPVVIIRSLMLGGISLTLASYYFASQMIVRVNQIVLRDRVLLLADSMLLGWLFPKGQMSLWLEHHSWLGPNTTFGAFIDQILSGCYLSYYFWPYFTLACLLARAVFIERRKGPYHEAASWRTVYSFTTCWVTCFMLIFLLNTLCPATSPRIYLRAEYEYPQPVFLKFIFGPIIHQDNTYGSFPSGHVAETLAVGLATWKLGVTPRLWKIEVIAAGLVALATVWLRYHYFMDVLSALAVAYLALMVSGCSTAASSVYIPKDAQFLSETKDVEMGMASEDNQKALSSSSSSSTAVSRKNNSSSSLPSESESTVASM